MAITTTSDEDIRPGKHPSDTPGMEKYYTKADGEIDAHLTKATNTQ